MASKKKQKSPHGLNFFVPGCATEQEAETAWQKMFGKFSQADPEQRIFSLAYRHNEDDFYIEVGKPDPDDSTAIVLAIFPERAYLVVTSKRSDIMIGYESTFGLIPFADYKGKPHLAYRE